MAKKALRFSGFRLSKAYAAWKRSHADDKYPETSLPYSTDFPECCGLEVLVDWRLPQEEQEKEKILFTIAEEHSKALVAGFYIVLNQNQNKVWSSLFNEAGIECLHSSKNPSTKNILFTYFWERT